MEKKPSRHEKTTSTIELLGFNIYVDSINEIRPTSKPTIVGTINPHSYIISKNDTNFKKALRGCDILLADGIGIAWTAKFIFAKPIPRISGPNLFEYLLPILEKEERRCFFLGSSNKTLGAIESKLAIEYPQIIFGSHSPPFAEAFTDEENKAMITAVNEFEPDVLFVGMTAPKQEKWVEQNKHLLKAKLICSIGAVFDFYAETVKMPGKAWDKLGLLWLVRFLREPGKLWKRNFISLPLFVIDVLTTQSPKPKSVI